MGARCFKRDIEGIEQQEEKEGKEEEQEEEEKQQKRRKRRQRKEKMTRMIKGLDIMSDENSVGNETSHLDDKSTKVMRTGKLHG